MPVAGDVGKHSNEDQAAAGQNSNTQPRANKFSVLAFRSATVHEDCIPFSFVRAFVKTSSMLQQNTWAKVFQTLHQQSLYLADPLLQRSCSQEIVDNSGTCGFCIAIKHSDNQLSGTIHDPCPSPYLSYLVQLGQGAELTHYTAGENDGRIDVILKAVQARRQTMH